MSKMVTIPLEELERLKEKNRRQARNITDLQETLARKNKDLDALLFVWCDGGCYSGIHRYDTTLKLTEEIVQRAERNTKRLRSWWNTVEWRLDTFPTMSEWHKKYAERNATKTDLVQD